MYKKQQKQAPAPQTQAPQMPAGPDFMAMMQQMQQGQQQNIQQLQERPILKPRMGITKDPNAKNGGTPGLDRWHQNNPNATAQPNPGMYGAFGQDRLVQAAPQPQLQQPQADPSGGLAGLLGGIVDSVQGMFAQPQQAPMQGAPAPSPMQSQAPMQQAPVQAPGPMEMAGPPAPMEMQGPPAPPNLAALIGQTDLNNQDGFNTLPQQLDPFGNVPRPMPGGNNGFVPLFDPTGWNRFQELQKQDYTVPLANAVRGSWAGLKQLGSNIANSYK